MSNNKSQAAKNRAANTNRTDKPADARTAGADEKREDGTEPDEVLRTAAEAIIDPDDHAGETETVPAADPDHTLDDLDGDLLPEASPTAGDPLSGNPYLTRDQLSESPDFDLTYADDPEKPNAPTGVVVPILEISEELADNYRAIVEDPNRTETYATIAEKAKEWGDPQLEAWAKREGKGKPAKKSTAKPKYGDLDVDTLRATALGRGLSFGESELPETIVDALEADDKARAAEAKASK